MDVPQLNYGELVGVTSCFCFDRNAPILTPRYIPLHPSVFSAPFAYTREFAHKVWSVVPDSIRADVSEIERVLQRDLDVVLTEEYTAAKSRVEFPHHAYRFSDFTLRTDPGSRSVDFSWPGVEIAMYDDGPARSLARSLDGSHPLPPEKLRAYAIGEEVGELVHVYWHVHNVFSAELPLALIFRNFAIQFNNLGLRMLSGEKTIGENPGTHPLQRSS
jgi:hypothetical protein